jgi:hypothetical protein
MKVSDEYQKLIIQHLTELNQRFPESVEQWIDIPQLATEAQRWEMYNTVKKFNPKCLVLSNQTLAVSEKNRGEKLDEGAWPTDLVNGEMFLPPVQGHNPHMVYRDTTYYIPFELCDNASDNGGPYGGADKASSADNWFDSPIFKMRSPEDLFWLYQQCMERRGNLLLNLPPVKRLRELIEQSKKK